MSTFGDNTPKQEILESLEYVKEKHRRLSWMTFLAMVAEVLAYLLATKEE